MQTIGLLGGMSWESTAHYYRLINEGINTRLGGLHSARLVLISVDFATIEGCMATDDWARAGDLLAADARRLEEAGAEMVLLCTNTMHKVAPRIEQAIGVPLVHIADATARTLAGHGVQKAGLLGTRFTMVEEFYRQRLSACHDLLVIVPDPADVEIIDRIIFTELCRGILHETSRAEYLRIIDNLSRRGAEAIVLGCTEIGMLITSEHTPVPLYDTTVIHAETAIALALGKGKEGGTLTSRS